MSKSNRINRITILFITIQYLTALLILVFFTTELSFAAEYIKNLLFYVIVFIAPIILVIKLLINERPIAYLGLKYNAKAIVIGVIIAVAMTIIFFVSNRFAVNEIEFDIPVVLTLTGGILAGVFEEVVFRGFYLNVFKRKLGFVWASILTAALFSVVHVRQIVEQGFIQIGILFVLALFLNYAYEKTKSLYVPIIIHVTFNVLIFVFM